MKSDNFVRVQSGTVIKVSSHSDAAMTNDSSELKLTPKQHEAVNKFVDELPIEIYNNIKNSWQKKWQEAINAIDADMRIDALMKDQKLIDQDSVAKHLQVKTAVISNWRMRGIPKVRKEVRELSADENKVMAVRSQIALINWVQSEVDGIKQKEPRIHLTELGLTFFRFAVIKQWIPEETTNFFKTFEAEMANYFNGWIMSTKMELEIFGPSALWVQVLLRQYCRDRENGKK
jgi:hypothetical protein